MSWKCPACGSTIRGHEHDADMPRVGTVYRCHICRLELIADAKTQRLVLAPIDKT